MDSITFKQMITPLASSNSSSISSSSFESSPSPSLLAQSIWSPTTTHGCRAITKRNLDREFYECTAVTSPKLEYQTNQQYVNSFQLFPQQQQQQQFIYTNNSQTIQLIELPTQQQLQDEDEDCLSDVFIKDKKSIKQLPIRSENVDLSVYMREAEKQRSENGKRMLCSFCKNNNETEGVYTSHNLKDALGRIICPILRNYKCQICHTSGDYAHTIKYCPILQKKSKLNKIKKFSNV